MHHEISEEEWARYQHHDSQRRWYRDVIRNRKESAVNKQWATQETQRHMTKDTGEGLSHLCS